MPTLSPRVWPGLEFRFRLSGRPSEDSDVFFFRFRVADCDFYLPVLSFLLVERHTGDCFSNAIFLPEALFLSLVLLGKAFELGLAFLLAVSSKFGLRTEE